MKNIYIVFSHSNSIVSRIIKFFTKEKYSHVSISLDDSCEHMYSFGRKYLRIAFIGCFNIESIKKGLYKIHNDSEMSIYKLKVTEKQYKKIVEKIDYIKKSSNGYNIIGLLLAQFRIRVNRNKYYCSEFVYKILSDKEINIISKDDEIFKPMELLNINGLELLYEGKVNEYMTN